MNPTYVIRSSRPAGISDSKVREMWSRIKYAIGQIFKKESTSDLSYEKLYRYVFFCFFSLSIHLSIHLKKTQIYVTGVCTIL